jgi:malate dehydrogenase (quinone)
VMLDVLERMAPDEFPTWTKSIKELIPTFGKDLNENAALAKKTMKQTAKSLKLTA